MSGTGGCFAIASSHDHWHNASTSTNPSTVIVCIPPEEIYEQSNRLTGGLTEANKLLIIIQATSCPLLYKNDDAVCCVMAA